MRAGRCSGRCPRFSRPASGLNGSAARRAGLRRGRGFGITGANGRQLHLTATPARHGPAGIEPLAGDVIGFLIGLDEPGDAIYVTGDTVWYEGVAEVARRYRPRLVILFAGAAKTRGPFHLTMDNNDAIETAHAFPEAQIVAVHNDSWAHFTESREDLERAFAALGLADRLRPLEPGTAVRLEL